MSRRAEKGGGVVTGHDPDHVASRSNFYLGDVQKIVLMKISCYMVHLG